MTSFLLPSSPSPYSSYTCHLSQPTIIALSFFFFLNCRMVSFKVALAILAMLLVVNSVSASFAVCAGGKDVSMWKTVYGFHLWNDDGQNSADYGSTTRNDHIDLSNNDWKVQPIIEVSKHSGDDSGTMRELRVSRNGRGWTFSWPDYVCKYGHDGRFRGIFSYAKTRVITGATRTRTR